VKRWFRHPRVQAALGALLAAYLRFALGTIRWRRVGEEPVLALWAAPRGALLLFWHARLFLSPASWPLDRAPPARGVISLSPDGEFLVKAVARLGIPAIRGSSGKKSDPAKAKGGAAAFREVLRWLNSGGATALTPDGPRGPREQMAEGAPMLAAMSGAPVLLLGIACRPCLRLKTWDRMVIPLPFGRGAIVWEGPYTVERAQAAAGVEPLRRAWAERLTNVTQRAEAMVR
jgi:lysophospholipid acyltransferase (LPLAT)-like uncharacterized protein